MWIFLKEPNGLERIHMINGLEESMVLKISPVNGLERCQMINGLENKTPIVLKEFT